MKNDKLAPQTTLREILVFEGVGLHTGAHARAEVRPAPAHRGIVFLLRSSSGNEVEVPATAEHVVDTSRATVVGKGDASVSTTEHLLSALFGMGVTNAEIRVDGPEIPIADGSAATFVAAIEWAGIKPLAAPRPVMTLDEPFIMQDGERMVAAFPAPVFRVRFVADFPPPIGAQYFCGDIDAASYRDEIAGARTFGYLHEIESLRARGLALGGTLDNAVVFAADGPVRPLRWHNEVVRHKVLDLIGDFALLGAWPQCEVFAIKSGHEMHALATRALRARLCAPAR